MEKFKCAISFLTIIPVKANINDEKDFRDMMLYFPFVALILGILYYIITYISYLYAESSLLSSVLYVVSSIVLTGGLHYDGLADSCDGLFSGRDKDKILEIMQDSRIGTFGVLGIITNVILKLGIIYAFIENDIIYFAILSVIFSRTMQVVYAYYSRYAKNDGMGNYFIGKIDKHTFNTAIISYLLISFILFIFFKGYSFSYILSTWFKTCLISILLLNFIVKRISKKLDGITGDILGMIAEISESLFLYIFFIVYNIF